MFFLVIVFGGLRVFGVLPLRNYKEREYAVVGYGEDVSGMRVEGKVGELDYLLVSWPKERLLKRNFKEFYLQQPQRLNKRRPAMPVEGACLEKRAPTDSSILLKRIQALNITDPGIHQQWHIINQKELGNDLNVLPVWEQGIFGNGTIIALIDDGIDRFHPDILSNFYANGSYDFNDHQEFPDPIQSDDNHGTRCAGEIVAVRNNVCGVGLAWEARVSGLRMLSADVDDATQVEALNYKFHDNHIYSCSWGPSDTGTVVAAPAKIVQEAFVKGVMEGRGGLGSIYVFASGNGGYNDDDCNYDGYTNNIYSVTIGSVDRKNQHPIYSEKCSAMLAVAYSSGEGEHIFTSDRGGEKCTNQHGGTSAAAPLVAGIFALVLSVRPDLNWRDFQHLVVIGAEPFNLNDISWRRTFAGYSFSHSFGYGRINAARLVEKAKAWESVGVQTNFTTPLDQTRHFIPFGSYGLELNATIGGKELANVGLYRLEHVTVTVSIEHERRGDLQIELESPQNVISILGHRRRLDESNKGFTNWTFMSVMHWYEVPCGVWKLRVIDNVNPMLNGHVTSWQMTLWGESRNVTMSQVCHIQSIPWEVRSDNSLIGLFAFLALFLVLMIAFILYRSRNRKTRNQDYEMINHKSIAQRIPEIADDVEEIASSEE